MAAHSKIESILHQSQKQSDKRLRICCAHPAPHEDAKSVTPTLCSRNIKLKILQKNIPNLFLYSYLSVSEQFFSNRIAN